MNSHNFNYWSCSSLKTSVTKANQLDIKQGNTPLENYSHLLSPEKSNIQLFLKREDLNPNGSFKDRALAYQISCIQQKKEKYCVLSSSGNAAISCCAFCQKTDIKPIILISPDTPSNKLSQIIAKKPFILIKSKKAYRFAKYISKQYKIPILNPSHDDRAITGFETLGWEINQQLPNCEAIFSYLTSGASVLGIHNFFHNRPILPKPQIIGVQSGRQTQLAQKMFFQNPSTEKQIAGKNSLAKIKRAKEISQTFLKQLQPQETCQQRIFISNNQQIPHGIVHWIDNQSIKDADQKLRKCQIDSSFEGAASLATALKFIKLYQLQTIVVIISGTKHPIIPNQSADNIYLIENLKNLNSLLTKNKISKTHP